MDEFIQRIKKSILRTAYRIGILEIQRFACRNKVNIVMYHRFSVKHEPFKVNWKSFEKQLKFISTKFNPIHLSTYVNAIEGNEKLPPNSIIVTIDDGYQDNYTIAYPLLRKFGVPATIFLATDFVDKGAWLWPFKLLFILQKTTQKKFRLSLNGKKYYFNVSTFKKWHVTQLAVFNYLRMIKDSEKELFLIKLADDLGVDVPEKTCGDFKALSWTQIREMQIGGIEFGSHTCSHPIMSKLNNQTLLYEVNASKNIIEDRIQVPVRTFCYPNGQPEDYNNKVIKAVRDAGYDCAVTTVNGINKLHAEKRYELKRRGLVATAPHDIYRGLMRQ